MLRESTERYPAAPVAEVTEVLHGQAVVDPYRWLEDAGDAATRRWSTQQQALFEVERGLWPQREPLAEWVRTAMSGDAYSVPWCGEDRQLFAQRTEGDDNPVLVSVIDGVRRILLDLALLDPSGRAVLQAWKPSWDGSLVAVQICMDGSEDAVLLVLDTSTGAVVDGPIDRVRRSSIGWLPDGRSFYYVRRLTPALHTGEERYHRRIYLHEVGSPVAMDALIFGAGRDKLDYYTVAVEPAKPWLIVTAARGTTGRRDVWIADISRQPDAPVLLPVQTDVQARTQIRFPPGRRAGDSLYLRTYLGADRGRVLVAEASCPDGEHRELIAEDVEAVLTELVIVDGPTLRHPLALVTRERHAVSEIAMFDLRDGSYAGTVPLPGVGTVSALQVDATDPGRVWFCYTDGAAPSSAFCYDVGTGALEPWGVPSSSRQSRPVITRQVRFCSADGTLVRMFVLSASGSPDQTRPTILTGYGGFGAVMTPAYRADAWAWVQAGGVYAVACLRGGGEEGTAWHRAGMGANKQNVFADFDAATDYLLREGWTTKEQLGIVGESNGGLLVAAALTQHPEKYAAVVCVAPLLDMVRYEKSGMGPSWRGEYGSADDAEEFRTLVSYSPYHRVRDGERYPAVLLVTFDADTRVDPLHARKMCARLQAATDGPRPVLLRTEAGVGHGARSTSSAASLLVDSLAFFAEQLGLQIPTPFGQ